MRASFKGLKPLVLLAYLAILGLFIWGLSLFYIPGKGFTYLVFFGAERPPLITELRELEPYYHNGVGYDGQHYAQMAISPSLKHPELAQSVDSISYRGRRILMSWTAYAMGLGQPDKILTAYTLINPICWFGLAILLLFWFPPTSWSHWLRWSGVLFSAGVMASTMRALVDGPSLLLVALGVFLIERNRPWLATILLGISGLGKETNLLGGSMLVQPRSLFVPRHWPLLIIRGALIILPLFLWGIYIKKNIGLEGSAGIANFSWPLLGLVDKLKETYQGAFVSGYAQSLHLGNLPLVCFLGIMGLAVQFLYLVLRPQWNRAWWRVGISFSVLMAVLGPAVWAEDQSPAVFRVLLPMQLAFNVLVPYSRRWLPVLIMGNLSVFCEIPGLKYSAGQVAELSTSHVLGADGKELSVYKSALRIEFPAEWHSAERDRKNYFRWSSGSAPILIVNKSDAPVYAALQFEVSSPAERDLSLLSPSGELVWQQDKVQAHQAVTTPVMRLAPGENRLSFVTNTAPSILLPDTRKLAFTFTNYQLRIHASDESRQSE